MQKQCVPPMLVTTPGLYANCLQQQIRQASAATQNTSPSSATLLLALGSVPSGLYRAHAGLELAASNALKSRFQYVLLCFLWMPQVARCDLLGALFPGKGRPHHQAPSIPLRQASRHSRHSLCQAHTLLPSLASEGRARWRLRKDETSPQFGIASPKGRRKHELRAELAHLARPGTKLERNKPASLEKAAASTMVKD